MQVEVNPSTSSWTSSRTSFQQNEIITNLLTLVKENSKQKKELQKEWGCRRIKHQESNLILLSSQEDLTTNNWIKKKKFHRLKTVITPPFFPLFSTSL
jgi:hypothetical protein